MALRTVQGLLHEYMADYQFNDRVSEELEAFITAVFIKLLFICIRFMYECKLQMSDIFESVLVATAPDRRDHLPSGLARTTRLIDMKIRQGSGVGFQPDHRQRLFAGASCHYHTALQDRLMIDAGGQTVLTPTVQKTASGDPWSRISPNTGGATMPPML